MSLSPSVTFVCCVESGSLEVQTVRMIESLRKWGGRFANSPLIAVTPRFGPNISRHTYSEFQRLDVKYVRFQAKTPYSWFKFLNKPLALVKAEEYTNSEVMCWLDSDLLILGEPEKLCLAEGEEFLGCASDKEMGTAGLGDAFEDLWQENCKAVSIDIDSLPWITTEQEGERIRLYWNGGIFAYRRSSGYARQYLNTCVQLLNARNNSKAKGYSIGINEMSAIGLAMVQLNLPWRALPYSHDYIMSSITHQEWFDEARLKEARIIHYHDSMWPWFWDEFLKCLYSDHPDVAAWLEPLGPIKNEATLLNRTIAKALKQWRTQKEVMYRKSCKVVA